ncbi:MAG: PQQ-binding-like beta-propeller repeat protein [Ardenticatenaceae bacterium]
MLTIFCSQCDELILDADACPACGWKRPLALRGVGEEVWSVELQRRLVKPFSYPAVAGTRFCLMSEDGWVVALAVERGELAWEFGLGEGCTAQGLATDGQRLFVGAVDVRPVPVAGKHVFALDAQTGSALWQYETTAHSISAATVAGARLYFTTSDGQLHSVEATNGQGSWSVAHPAWSPAAPTVGDERVYAGGRGNSLVAYAAEDGAVVWRFAAEGWFADQSAVAGGRVYAPCWDGNLYVLDAPSGKVLWKYRGERGRGITSPPVVARGQVFLGSRVNREDDEPQGAAYALLALDEDGIERWRFHTERHITAPVTVAADTVLFAAEDGFFFALDAATGEERWRVQIGARVVTQPQLSGDLVYFGEREGTVYALRWQGHSDEALLDPQAYRRQGKQEQAATAHALRGEFGEAAMLYETAEIGRPQRAAQLYERAGQVEKAASLWEGMGDLRRARDSYRRAGDQVNLARTLADMGESLEAAHLYEESGNVAEAARLYELAGDRVRAAELYQQGGAFGKAQSIWKSLGRWEQEVESLVGAGDFAAAGAILEQRGQLERAAELYEKGEHLEQALAARLQLQNWESVAALSARLGAHEQEAEARERLGQLHRAAQGYERAAEQATTAEPADEERIATLYERAARLYAETFDSEREAACRKAVHRFRRLPDIVVHGVAQTAFVENEWNTLRLEVKNAGYGPAGEINVLLRGSFDVQGETIRGLRPQSAAMLDLFIRPHEDQIGPKVPMEIVVVYEDRQGTRYEGAQRIPVRVVRQGTTSDAVTPSVVLRLQGQRVGAAGKEKAAPPPARLYHNFDLRLALTEDNRLAVEVLSSPAGEARDVAPLPDVATDSVEPDQEPDLAALGNEIGNALFPDAIRYRFESSLGRIDATGEGLRLRLRCQDETVAAIPWEAARLDDEYLSLRPQTPLVRYVLAPYPPRPLPVQGALKLLGIVSGPQDQPQLDLAREKERLEQAVAPLLDSDRLQLTWLDDAQLQPLQDALRQGPHMIHFIGHGSYDPERQQGSLLFQGDDGWSRPVAADWFATLLRDSTVRLVFLNACDSGRAVGGLTEVLVRRGMPAALGLQTRVVDEAAIAFAAGFYRALSDGWPVDAATVEGRRAIVNRSGGTLSQPDWVQPIVHMRAPDGKILDFG